MYSLRKYFDAVGPVTWQRADKKTGTAERFVYSKDKAATLKPDYEANPDGFRDSLMSTPFWRVIQAPDPFEGFDLAKVINAAIAKFKRLKGDPEKADKVVGDPVAALKIEQIVSDMAKAKDNAPASVPAVLVKAAKVPAKTKSKAKAKTNEELVVH
jgi:hypothetical protein